MGPMLKSPDMRATITDDPNLSDMGAAADIQRSRSPLHRLINHPSIAALAALLGGLVLLGHLYGHVHGLQSVTDEGLYLYKGFLFASGRYVPFQDNGPWTNHMPLSFLIPGWVQQIFGLGLRTGRYYAMGVTLLLALGLWVVTRRLSGRWMAAGAVWFLALNVALVKMYSQAISQGLVAMMLIWIMALALGERRRLWQLVLASILAGLILLTRLNLLPLLPLLVLYIIWQNGWRAGLIAGAAGFVVVIIGHALYWPDILKIWAKWLPAALTPFLEAWRVSPIAEAIWNPPLTTGAQLSSLLISLRQHMLPLLGVLFAWLSWPTPSLLRRPDPTAKMVYFLTAVFGVLFAIHAWAALANNYCIFCLRIYITFFSLLGLLLFAVTLKPWFGILSLRRRVSIIVVLLVTALALGSYNLNEIGRSLAATQLPRVASLRLWPGSMALSVFLYNKFGMPYPTAVQNLATGWLVITILLAVSLAILIVWNILRRPPGLVSRGLYASFTGLTIVWMLGQGIMTGNTYTSYDCGDDVIGSYETVGAYLRENLPADALIYWVGGRSPVTLLYLPEARIFPAQLNGVYTFHQGGTPDDLLRFGYWNQELAYRWLGEADFVLVEESLINSELGRLLTLEDYVEISPAPTVLDCRPDSSIHIYRRTGEPN